MNLKDIEEKSIHLLLHEKYTKIANNSNDKLNYYKIFDKLK